jgi:exonuclease V gamma subunit
MSIQLYFSNRLDELAEKFVSTLSSENRHREDIFNAPLVITPNNNLIKWLQLMIAEKQSVCMNMDFQFLENGLWGMLAKLDAEKLNPEFLDNKCLQMLLVHALQNLDTKKPEFIPVNTYLFDSENIKRPD